MKLPLVTASLLEDLGLGLRFLGGLRGYLRRPMRQEEAKAILSRRLEQRSEDFLRLVHRGVYGNLDSPYRRLLGLAGCERGDLEALVRREGLEAALRALLGQGVYVTLDEFKGRVPVVRGSTSFSVQASDFLNPLADFHVPTRSSGSRGAGTPLIYGFSSIRDRVVNTLLTLEARGGTGWVKAVWGLPGGGVPLILRFAGFGRPPARWFTPVDPAEPGLDRRYRLSARALRWGSLLAGVPLPGPILVSPDDPRPIVGWLREVLSTGQSVHVWSFPSSAVRLCQAALEMGVALEGVHFTVTGEPITAVRMASIRRTGAEAVPDYGSTEAGGFVSYGCLAPEAVDEVHFFQDLHGLVQADGGQPGLPRGTLLLTSLRSTSPVVLLNTSMGDHAVVRERRCGCPLERPGWTTHLESIRSFEKLTAGGMTFLDGEVIQILDEILPARFGGGPSDYQLVEDAGADGRSRLRLLVRPTVGELDEGAVAEAFLEAVGQGSAGNRVMASQWRRSNVLTVERAAPLPGKTGKILHLHQVSVT